MINYLVKLLTIQSQSSYRKALVAIFLLAFLLRVGYVIFQYQSSAVNGGFVTGDGALYLKLSSNFSAGKGFSLNDTPTDWIMPGYPLFLSACAKLFGSGTQSVSIVQCVLGALACVLIAAMAAKLFGNAVGVIAGLLAATYYELIIWTSGIIMTEPIYVFLIALSLYLLVTARQSDQKKHLWWLAASGTSFGLAALVRPPAFLTAMSMAALLAAQVLIQGLNGKSLGNLVRPFIFGGCCLLVLIPWGIRNRLRLGEFLLVSTESGYVLWLGNNPGYDRLGFSKQTGYPTMFPPLPESAGKSEIEINHIHRQASFEYIREEPLRWLERAFYKLWNTWRPVFIKSSMLRRMMGYTLYPVLLGLALAGAALSIRNFDHTWPLLAFVVINLLLVSAITGEIRFRFPLWPALIPFSAFAVSRLIDNISRKKGAVQPQSAHVPELAPLTN